MATFSISPAVTFTETDLTTAIATVSNGIGAVSINAAWGPVNERVLITHPDYLSNVFGKPNDINYDDWFQAFNFLAYSNSLYVVRTVGANALNASDVQVLTSAVNNYADFQLSSTIQASTNTVLARYAGDKGNDISVSYANETSFSSWAYADEFEYAPDATNQEINLVVLLEGEVVERFYLSGVVGSTDYQGDTNFITEKVNRSSEYIYLLDNFIVRDAQDVLSLTTATITLSNGNNGDYPVLADYQLSSDLFAESGEVDINYAIQTFGSGIGKYLMENVSMDRLDSISVVGPDYSTVVGKSASSAADASVAVRATMGSSSYGFYADNYKYQYDKFNDKYRWVSLCGDTAGLMARATTNGYAWTSPAGYTHGKILNVERLAYNPNKALRDLLYKNQCNPIISDGNEGHLLLGDKTLQSRQSAFSFYNVRQLFIVIEKAIASASKYQLFDQNDEFSRGTFRNMVTPYLRTVKAQRGLSDFQVVCDTSNNTPEIEDLGQFIADIYVKPLRTIQGMNLNFVATKTGVTFEEVIG